MSKEDEYYNYIAFYRGIPVYVGKGVGKRWVHTINGQSGSELINDFYFRAKYLNDMPLDTYIVKRFKTDAQALKGERVLINKYLPYCNKCAGRFHSDNEEICEKISEVSKILGMDKPEALESKFDFRFLFTPKGLLCRNVNLNKNSPFEYAEEEYHIRVKSKLFKFFPENLLQFMENDRTTWGSLLTSLHTKPLYFNENTLNRGVMFDGLDVDINWKVTALLGGSFDFAEKFGFTFDRYDIEKFIHQSTVVENHVVDYKTHLDKQKSIQEKKERQERLKEEKAKQASELREKAMNNPNIKLRTKHSDIRVKISDEIESYVKGLGFDYTGCGKWLNLSTSTKPYLSISAMSRYVRISQDEFLLLNLNSFRKR